MQTIKVAGIQMGTYTGDYESNMSNALTALDKTASDFKPDIVCFSELMTVPYFACTYNDKFFELAEPIPGRTTKIMADAAKKHGFHIIATTFEKAEDKYYNSAFLVSPAGELKGVYRKVHIPKSGDRKLLPIDEQYYFSGGNDLPVFDLNGIPIGILICFDRSITESFRVLMLKGAKIVFVPVATFGMRKDPFWEELKVRGMENHIFVIAVNKAGDEICEGEEVKRHHFGRSCIIGPMGDMLASLEDEPFGVLTGTIDLSAIDLWVKIVDWRSFRKPKLYDIITKTR